MLVNSVENLISDLSGSGSKPKDCSKINLGTFEALLSVLLSQGMNYQGNSSIDSFGIMAEGLSGRLDGGQGILDFIGALNGFDILNGAYGTQLPVFQQDRFSVSDIAAEVLNSEGIDCNPYESGSVDSLNAALIKAALKEYPSGNNKEIPSDDTMPENADKNMVEDISPDLGSAGYMAQAVDNLSKEPVPLDEKSGGDAAQTAAQPVEDAAYVGKEAKGPKSAAPHDEQKMGIYEKMPHVVAGDDKTRMQYQKSPAPEGKPTEKAKALNDDYKSLDSSKYTETIKQSNNPSAVQDVPKDEQSADIKPEVLKVLERMEAMKMPSDDGTELRDAARINGEANKSRSDKADKYGILPVKMKAADKAYGNGGNSFVAADINEIIQNKTQSNTEADISHVVQSNRDSILEQICDRIKVINRENLTELHLNLKPDELGEVAIKLVMDKGNMTARIAVENSHVKALIESNIPQIRDNLKNQNINVSNFSVSVGVNQEGFSNSRSFMDNSSMPGRKYAHTVIHSGSSEKMPEQDLKNSMLINLLV